MARVLAEKRALVVALTIAIVANIVLYIIVVFPLGRQVLSAQVDQHEAHQALNRARTDDLNARATITGKQQADASLQQFYTAVLPRDASEARRLTFTQLSQLADQSRVRLEHGTNAVERVKGSQLSKLSTTYTLSGDYRDVRKFIFSLETASQFLVLEKVGLTGSNDAQQRNRGVAVTLDIATYFRTPDAAN